MIMYSIFCVILIVFCVVLIEDILAAVDYETYAEKIVPISNDEKWDIYKKNYNKTYSESEDIIRKGIFLDVDKMIHAHNKNHQLSKSSYEFDTRPKNLKKLISFPMTHNQFSVLDKNEKKKYLGADVTFCKDCCSKKKVVAPQLQRKWLNYSKIVLENLYYYYRSLKPFPFYIKIFRSDSCNHTVKDQGSCSSSSVFSVLTTLEFMFCKYAKNSMDFSEQEIISCDTNSGGCNGSWPSQVMSYLKSSERSHFESDYPYTSGQNGTTGECHSSSSNNCKINNHNNKMADFKNLDFKSPNSTIPWEFYLTSHVTGSEEILSVVMSVVDSFYQYHVNGYSIYSDPTCNNEAINHAVVLIGFFIGITYDYDSDNDVQQYKTPAWIVRNSWGIDWGYYGDFFIERGVNMCNIETYAYYPVWNSN